MTQKQECLCYCIDHLESRSLAHIFNIKVFNAYYDKHYNAIANIYNIGVNAADALIESYNPQEVYNG